MTQTVLLAGATGMLGRHIARRLLDRPEARLRLLVRDSRVVADGRHAVTLGPLLARGAELVGGDLADWTSLDRATEGVDVIVSAVQGGADVIVEGQEALAEAGRRNGVRRILPSDFGLDLFKATPGEHAMFDLRRQADARIAATGIEHVHVLQGAFMDMFLPGKGAIDLDAGTVTFWGDGNQLIDTTSVEDTARMVARVALDRAVTSGKLAFAGDRVSFRSAAAIIAEQTGRTLRPISLGSEAELRAALASAEPPRKVLLAYALYMSNGQTALTGLQNNRYPDIALEDFAGFAARSMPLTASA